MTGIKRTNPETNAPFKYGDVREDGYIFWSYQMHVIRKDGTYAEKWKAPEIFAKAKAEAHKRSEGVKRINSTTGKPFVCGFTDPSTGLVFYHYKMTQKADQDGYFVEKWVTAEQYEIIKKQKNEAQKRRQKKRDDLDFLVSSRWKSAKLRAEERSMTFTITKEYLKEIYPSDGLCPILRVKMTTQGATRDPTPTLDRIDNSKGYVHGNVAWISFRANQAKSDTTAEEIRGLAEYMGITSKGSS